MATLTPSPKFCATFVDVDGFTKPAVGYKLKCIAMMQKTFSCDISCVSLFWSSKGSKLDKFSAQHDLRYPLVSMFHCTNESTCVVGIWGSAVLHVERMFNISKIVSTIVKWIAINVIDSIRWPSVMVPKPDQSMSEIFLAKKTNVPVPIFPNASSHRSDNRSDAWSINPNKLAIISVLQNRSKLLCGNTHTFTQKHTVDQCMLMAA